MHISEMKCKGMQLQRLPIKWESKGFQHSDVWKKRRSQEKRLEIVAYEPGGKLSRYDVLDEKVVNHSKCCREIK